MQTITEADIQETQLWHEYQGHRPPNRNQNPCREWKTKKCLTNLTLAVILKGAGIGWGRGRGKVIAEEAATTSGAPVEMKKRTSDGWNSSTGHNRLHNFNSPLQCNNEKWKPSFGRGTRVKETFKPNHHNVQEEASRGETRTGEKSRFDQAKTNNVWRARNSGQGETEAPNHPENNSVWQGTSFGRGETEGAWKITTSQRANNNVWRATSTAGGNAWTSSSNGRANSNVWRATNSGIVETRAAVISRSSQAYSNNFRGSARSNWGGERRAR